ncbi:hypothetical protein MNEG_13268 [Monoraphidium neglectum]|uniref:Uncharacterized protein n=1 Tax=Monoraphidium neglectum TaxID=145388 RepID=A0A0D2MI99_9CHLO|nr:hypothetical protein MNEG_13268 [Monoraphidium neglectum]KIY94695.1 hypothetical protein MNEG_13268 [Monoraphidium neglectum]|eukprot:XP_013893715.1 hypothetical protein MNEG_13268 [Monoraphidium neglectum]
MPSKAPTLPAKGKKAAPTTAATLPVLSAQYITLEDGSQIPIKVPPGMPADQALAVVEYLKNNPEAAKQAWQQAQMVMRTMPGAAQALTGQLPAAAPAGEDVFNALKDDPELAEVFEDVKANGVAALQKYWEDTDLMSKISSKMRAMQISKQQQQQAGDAAAPAAAAAAAKGGAAARKVETLHDAARWGDVEAAGKLIDGGADVDGKNDKGIPALGVAVGFNQKEIMQLLIKRGADVGAADGRGSTALHYAAVPPP